MRKGYLLLIGVVVVGFIVYHYYGYGQNLLTIPQAVASILLAGFALACFIEATSNMKRMVLDNKRRGRKLFSA